MKKVVKKTLWTKQEVTLVVDEMLKGDCNHFWDTLCLYTETPK